MFQNVKKISLALLILGSIGVADEVVMPYTTLSDEYAENLNCIFSKHMERKSMQTSLAELDIRDEQDILAYMREGANEPLDNYAKGIILDYLYKMGEAREYYREAMPLVEANRDIGIDIVYFLARTGDIESAESVIKKMKTILNGQKLDRLLAYIYVANRIPLNTRLRSSLKRQDLSLKNIKEGFLNCRASVGF